MAVLTGVDFFTVEVLTSRGLATYYVLFFVQLETRRITIAGITRHPTAEWMLQMSRNATDEESGPLHGQRYLLHDRDTKFCPAFRNVLRSAGVRPVVLPPQSPNLKAYASHCTSSARFDRSGANRRRSQSFPFRPCIFRGGFSRGCSYKRSFLSLNA
jgi:hypothetical protein